ncbi:hypothetical protein DAI22_10g202800 [Oryza sativa Japonica Group]|nr:hypothetical protein DAI22_10g202800 [Oryza sativa Japonica Group]
MRQSGHFAILQILNDWLEKEKVDFFSLVRLFGMELKYMRRTKR